MRSRVTCTNEATTKPSTDTESRLHSSAVYAVRQIDPRIHQMHIAREELNVEVLLAVQNRVVVSKQLQNANSYRESYTPRVSHTLQHEARVSYECDSNRSRLGGLYHTHAKHDGACVPKRFT